MLINHNFGEMTKPPMLPPEVQTLCSHYLEQVRNHPHHHMSSKGRIEIYQAFGESARPNDLKDLAAEEEKAKNGSLIFSQADKVLGYLSFLTAEKVVPIWQRARSQPDGAENEELYGNPITVIEVGRKILQGTEPLKSSIELLAQYQANTFCFEEENKYELEFVFATGAACEALETLYSGITLMVATGAAFYEDAMKAFPPHDFASKAIIAYAGFEEDNPNEKRLEFWKWWLTEAIPQAWELAQRA